MSYVPYDWEGEFPDDFWDKILDEDENGWIVDYPDENGNGFPDCMEDLIDPGVILRPSQEGAGS